MDERELGTALTILRVARGFTQEELAKLSGVRSGSISDYECCRMTPGLKTLRRLLGGMGYSLSAIEQAQGFLRSLNNEASLRASANPGSEGPGGEELTLPGQGRLHQEMEEVALLGGTFVSRLIRLLFLVLLKGRRADRGKAVP